MRKTTHEQKLVLCELWDTTKHMNIHIMGVPEEERKEEKTYLKKY